ncbi:hypothetical protein [Lutibacter sp.]|uniref:hypothetical protein n=1 Tax=Lutibacter sp. TaxID=1925666 RepID=UPI0025C4CBFB|nr:hypothetical protein [Lutibacter sp.]MCF6182670.1 hypothetical protein [Lutibacter sp.]
MNPSQNILFIHSHNKQTLKDVVQLLTDSKIPVAAIADIDLLNDETNFKNLYEALTTQKVSKALLKTRAAIDKSVKNQNDTSILNSIKSNVEEFLEQLNNSEHTLDGAKGALNRIRKEATKWATQKEKGVSGFDTEYQKKVNRFIGTLKSKKLFIVPVGELEKWIPLGVKKNKWVIPALNKIYEGKTPDNLKHFIKSILVKMGENVS